MGRYENSLKCVEIRRLLDTRNYKKAASILETMDVDKIKSITDLNAFADVYRKTGQYDLAEEILLRVYEKSPTYRVIYKLVTVSIKRGNLEAAEAYFKDYLEVAPETVEKYILRYRMDKVKHSSYETRIESLEQIKRIEYIEEWAYELAKLYHKAGMSAKCVAECDDIILWFSEGVIVEKAKMLRAYYVEGADILTRPLKVRDQLKKAQKSSSGLKMDTLDLSRQIQQLAESERQIKVARELQHDLEKTTNIQMAIQRDLEQTSMEQGEEEQQYYETEDENQPWLYGENNMYEQAPPMDEYQEHNYEDGTFYEAPVQEIENNHEEYVYSEQVEESPYSEAETKIQEDVQIASSMEPMGNIETEVDTKETELYEERNIAAYVQSCEEEAEKENQQKDGQQETMATQQSILEEDRLEKERALLESQETKRLEIEKIRAEKQILEQKRSESSLIIGGIDVSIFFADYAEDPNIRVQIVTLLQQLEADEACSHFLITADNIEDATAFSKSLAKALLKIGRIKSSKLAKINGNKLNRMDLVSKQNKLVDTTVVIEEANEMYVPTVKNVIELIEIMAQKVVVVLEGTDYDIDILLTENCILRDYFKYMIRL